jgi:hypothetical protein
VPAARETPDRGHLAADFPAAVQTVRVALAYEVESDVALCLAIFMALLYFLVRHFPQLAAHHH